MCTLDWDLILLDNNFLLSQNIFMVPPRRRLLDQHLDVGVPLAIEDLDLHPLRLLLLLEEIHLLNNMPMLMVVIIQHHLVWAIPLLISPNGLSNLVLQNN